METIYSSRRDGAVDQKIFWGPIDADFEKELRNLVALQNGIKNEYVLRKKQLPDNISNDQLFLRVDRFLNDMFIRNEKYPIEMFLYSLKCTSGLMPERGSGIPLNLQQKGIERYYISLLASKLNSILEKVENPEQELSMQGLSHVLKHWPRYGAWKKPLFVAISVVGRINIELPLLDKTISEFLSDDVLWECAFYALSIRKDYKYNSKRLMSLLQFMTEAGSSNSTVKRGIFSKAYPRFKNLLDKLIVDDKDLYGELYLQADSDNANLKLPVPLKQLFRLGANGPEGLMEAQNKEDYLREHFSIRYDEWNSWQTWILKLEDEKLFKVLCDIYETTIFPNSTDYETQSRVLSAFAKMNNKKLGAHYLHWISSEGSMLKPRDKIEEFIRKAMLLLADGNGSIHDLTLRFEQMSEYERRNVLYALRELYLSSAYREKIRLRINELINELDSPNGKAVEKLIIIDAYLQAVPKWLKENAVNNKLLANKLKTICGYNPEKDALNAPSIPFRTLNAVIILLNNIITRAHREDYRDLLYSLLETREELSVKAIMQDMWSGEE